LKSPEKGTVYVTRVRDYGSWDRVGLVMAHALVSHWTRLRLCKRCTNEAHHHQPAWRTWSTRVRAIRQSRPCYFQCVFSSHSSFPMQPFSPHYFARSYSIFSILFSTIYMPITSKSCNIRLKYDHTHFIIDSC